TTRLQPVVLQLSRFTKRLFVARTPPGFSRWYFNFPATQNAFRRSDTTRLQPVVLQLLSYTKRISSLGHHQASAGGTSTSQLHKTPFVARTPPGFSRWYFNFSATTKAKNFCDCRASAISCPSWCSCEIESPKAGGVPARLSGPWCSCEIESPKAGGVP